jgi:ABC-type transporter Mla subunit MlaD
MAAANKPTAVHFSLVFFVMTTLILLVTTYLFKKGENEALSAKDKADKSLAAKTTEFNQLQSEVSELKTVLGSQLDRVGGAGDGGQDTVTGAMLNAIKQQGGPQAGTTAIQTLAQMRTQIDNLTNQVQTLTDSLNNNNKELQAANAAAQARVDMHQQSAQGSEQQLQELIAKRDELVREKDTIIAKWTDDFRSLQAEHQTLKDELDRVRKEKDERIALLETQLDRLNYQVAERVREALRSANVTSDLIDYIFGEVELVLKERFEQPDGEIVSVDNTARTVWLNIGSQDGLRPQVSFSVYTRDNRGLGRSDRDIKAKVEVTRIKEAHLAEARIIEEDLSRPISPGDPIYSPLWSAGRTEYFAFVGRPDLDEDGASDWDLLMEILRNAGAKRELYVTDEGLREPANGKLTARTKFLVVGDIDDLIEFSGQPEKMEIARKILDEQEALLDDAKVYGVQVVRLNDFLAYIGYKSQHRLWRPGEDRPFTLQRGAHSASVDETFNDRSSSGQVSELFRRNRLGRQRESEGTTSGLFRNK